MKLPQSDKRTKMIHDVDVAPSILSASGSLHISSSVLSMDREEKTTIKKIHGDNLLPDIENECADRGSTKCCAFRTSSFSSMWHCHPSPGPPQWCYQSSSFNGVIRLILEVHLATGHKLQQLHCQHRFGKCICQHALCRNQDHPSQSSSQSCFSVSQNIDPLWSILR